MLVPAQKQPRNRLLAALSEPDCEALRAASEPVTMRRGDVLSGADEILTHAVFVEAGVISAVAQTAGGRRIEIGLVGREGFMGVPLLLGVDRTSHESLVQIEGEALRLPRARFLELLERRPAIAPLLLRYAHVFHVQTAQTAVSNGSYTLEERLARWLLMCHDRVDGDDFPITHAFLATMLCVRRAGVTTTVHVLEGAGMIEAQRSRIRILDRPKLEAAAGDSYGVAEAEYGRLIGPPEKAKRPASSQGPPR